MIDIFLGVLAAFAVRGLWRVFSEIVSEGLAMSRRS